MCKGKLIQYNSNQKVGGSSPPGSISEAKSVIKTHPPFQKARGMLLCKELD